MQRDYQFVKKKKVMCEQRLCSFTQQTFGCVIGGITLVTALLHSSASSATCHAQYQGPDAGRITWEAAIIKQQWSGAYPPKYCPNKSVLLIDTQLICLIKTNLDLQT